MTRVGLQLLLFLEITAALQRAVTFAASDAAAQALPASLSTPVTNIAQLRTLSYIEFNQGRPVCLTGNVTLVDNEQRRLVLQDGTGAIMWYCGAPIDPTLIGKTVRVTCACGSPYVPTVPDFPYRPSGSDLQSSFEAPSNWGDYHLTRMAGYLRPPNSGEYTFWIASDDSSELWLSTNESPTCVKQIAFVMEGFWTNPHEWNRFPSQRSEPIYLRAGQTYYVEAFQEQGLQADHLSVAWEGPGIGRSVIPGAFLTPWSRNGATLTQGAGYTPTNGILREYWTNYAAGTVRLITASGAVEAGFAGRDVSVQVLGPGSWPQPQPIDPAQPLQPENNFRWVQTKGIVSFLSTTGEGATLELVAGPKRLMVRVARWDHERLRVGLNQHVQVRGVCEGIADETENMFPGIIWAPSSEEIRVIEAESDSKEPAQAPEFTPASSAVVFGGYYVARGAVAFDGTIAGRRYLYVQDLQGGVCVSEADRVFQTPLEVGQRVLAGGTLSPSKAGLKLVPRTLRLLGRQNLPIPSELGDGAGFRDGQWTEVRGVVHSVRADGVWTVQGPRGLVSVWSPKTPADESLVDCAVRIRGVMSLEVPDAPQLLVGSSSLVEIDERGPSDPFSLPRCSISSLGSVQLAAGAHRVKVEGTITYIHERTCFLQDDSGAVQLPVQPDSAIHVDDRVEAVGFPVSADPIRVLAEPRLRVLGRGAPLAPRAINLSDAIRYNGSLVRVRASLLVHKNLGRLQVLELQASQRICSAVLAGDGTRLPPLPAGSQVEITGVCVARAAPEPSTGPANWEILSRASLQLLLRAPTDVTVRRTPPWWTPKKVMASTGGVVTVLGGTLVWMRLLRRKYELRQRSQLEFSRQILESQEKERRRIAVNLHDSLGQNLLVIKNQACLAMQPGLERPAVLQRLNEISGMASQVIEEVRQITHDLRPSQLDRVGLSQTLRGTIRNVSESGTIAFASHVDEIDGLFERDGEIHIYRILQEGLNNVVKHSGATEATAVVKKEGNCLLMIVRDNGHGFASSSGDGSELPQAGLGLSGISERARILHGKVAFDSDPGQGFRLTVEIPLPGNHDTP